MKWRFAVTRLVRDDDRSKYGKYNAVEKAEVTAYKRQFERKHRVDSLTTLAEYFGYTWDFWSTGKPRALKLRVGGASLRWADRGFKRTDNDDFDDVLQACLEDVGRVVDAGSASTALIPRSLKSDKWLLDEGWADIFWLGPTGRDESQTPAEPCDYTRLVIVFNVGKVAKGSEEDKKEPYNHRYEWTLEYCDETKFIPAKSIEKFSPAKIHQVCDKVFIIRDVAGIGGILKFEAPNVSAEKYDSVWTLCRLLFESTPASYSISNEEIEYMRKSKLENGPNYKGQDGFVTPNAPQAEFLFFYGDGKIVLRKMEFCDVKDSLLQVCKQARHYAAIRGDLSKANRLHKSFFTREHFNILGKMAAVDAVTGNNDRLAAQFESSTGSWINAKNIDFDSSGRVIAIDNIDPNSQLFSVQKNDVNDVVNSWPAYKRMMNSAGRKEFADRVVRSLIIETTVRGNAAPIVLEDRNTIASCTDAFVDGLSSGVEAMKGIRASYPGLTKEFGPTAQAICARIDAIH